MNGIIGKTPRFLIFLLIAFLLSGGISILNSINAQNQKQKEIQNTDNFKRPTPQKPIKPTIPSVNRFQEDKVFLEQADSLFKPLENSYFTEDLEEKQIVKGNVVFRQGGMWMYCDSAYYFPDRNSLDAFGNVEMKQGDTLFVYADKLYYNGAEKMAILVGGPSRKDVTLKDPSATLTTDSLNYDLNQDIGWYDSWGILEDNINTLTSKYGEYSPSTKIAVFKTDVELKNSKDGFDMYTQELIYNTGTNIATINTETKIVGENDTILTSSGNYNTSTDNAVLTSRSTIIHKDSSQNVVTLEGDSIIYDKLSHISRAYKFNDISKHPMPMVLTDTARKTTLIGGFGQYNDSLKEAFSTDYPLLIEYSRPDTLFLRADTISTSIRVENVWPDSLQKSLPLSVRKRLQSYNSLQEIADDFYINVLTIPRNLSKPGSATKLIGFSEQFFLDLNDLKDRRKKAQSNNSQNEDIEIISKDSLIETNSNPELENVDEHGLVNNTETEVEHEIDELSNSTDSIVSGSVDLSEQTDSLKLLNSADSIRPLKKRIDSLERDSAYMVPKEFNVAKAIGRARLFNQDIQGVADTMIYQEYDTMIYLIRKPIVWSGERQVYGTKINIHFNDSNVDRADLPESGFLAEYIDEDFYNQLSGKKMVAYFQDNELTHLFVNGNVETIFLPMENDSTYNRLVTAESSYLTIDMTSRQMDRLKMWPEVSGAVIPLFMVKKAQQYLPGFKWYEALRPKREWYGSGWKWIDDLGEVPEELENYFKQE